MIPVFYTPKQVVTEDVGVSPSARKPAEVVASWQAAGFPIEIIEPEPVSRTQLRAAHDSAYIDDVLTGRRPNGFGTRSRAVIWSLPWTTGSLLSAARYVVDQDRPVAVSPTSGFHHAGYASGGGFCTFNGLMVTALDVTGSGQRRVGTGQRRVGILDCDEHYGNGTDDIIDRLRSDVVHYTFGGDPLPRLDPEKWLKQLPEIVARFKGCDVVLYQAGADPHVDDPFGGTLTTEQLLTRDRIVFATLRDLDVPVVWNLAGGYQQPLRKVLDIHDNTMRACVEVFAAEV